MVHQIQNITKIYWNEIWPKIQSQHKENREFYFKFIPNLWKAPWENTKKMFSRTRYSTWWSSICLACLKSWDGFPAIERRQKSFPHCYLQKRRTEMNTWVWKIENWMVEKGTLLRAAWGHTGQWRIGLGLSKEYGRWCRIHNWIWPLMLQFITNKIFMIRILIILFCSYKYRGSAKIKKSPDFPK